MSANQVTVSTTTNTITGASPGTGGPQGGTGAAGANGSDGTNGYSAHVGSGAPSNSLGAVNDIYFDNSNHVLYKKTGSTTWTSQGSYSSGSGGVNSFLSKIPNSSILIGSISLFIGLPHSILAHVYIRRVHYILLVYMQRIVPS